MSVETLLNDKSIRALIDSLVPRERWPSMRLKAKPGRNSGGLVGTAFDYAVRFELQRRHRAARCETWTAEGVIESLAPIAQAQATWERLDEHGEVLSSIDSELLARWTAVVRAARAFHDRYVHESQPSPDARKELAMHALRLARIDPYQRAGYVDRNPEKVESVDLADLIELLRIVPWSELDCAGPLWLNPTFGAVSERVGGADCDLISGDRLIDLKTTSNPAPRNDFRQVIVYLLLARAARAADPGFSGIRSVGVYYARHRELVLIPVEKIAPHDVLERAQKRFFAQVKKLNT